MTLVMQKANFDSCATKLQKISCKTFYKKSYVNNLNFVNFSTIFSPRLQQGNQWYTEKKNNYLTNTNYLISSIFVCYSTISLLLFSLLPIKIRWKHVFLDAMHYYWDLSTQEVYFSPSVIWMWFFEKKLVFIYCMYMESVKCDCNNKIYNY